MNQCSLSKYTSISASTTGVAGIAMVCKVHGGLRGDPGCDASPGIAEVFEGALVPKFLYMFIASEIADLLAPNCWAVSGDPPAGAIVARPSPLGAVRCSSGLELFGTTLGRLLVLDRTDPSPLPAVLRGMSRSLGADLETIRGRHSTPERTHMMHGFVASHFARSQLSYAILKCKSRLLTLSFC